MRLLRKLLFPFSIVYGGVMLVRNALYNRNFLTTRTYEVPVICVGNLSVGGTGKSPMVEYLISLLESQYRLATLSRGYKRNTRGFHLLSGNEAAVQVGDEPLQFKTKFSEVMVAVDEVRSHGIDQLLDLEHPPEVILLDDAFQHRKVTASLNIILTPYRQPYTRDSVLPAGNLREPIRGARRAQVIVVTKCPPNLGWEEMETLSRKLKINETQDVFFTRIAYSETIFNESHSLPLDFLRDKKFTLVTGIASPDPLIDFLLSQELSFTHLNYPDHHTFSSAELKTLRKQSVVLTTEKDFMRLQGSLEQEHLYFLPIQTEFLERKDSFDRKIRCCVTKK